MVSSFTTNYRHLTGRTINSSFDNIHSLINKKNTIQCSYVYQRSYNNGAIAGTLLPTNPLYIEGSKVTSHTTNALVADYFGLSDHFKSSAYINPTIESHAASLYAQYYFSPTYIAAIYGIAGSSNYQLRIKETVSNESNNSDLPAGYNNISLEPTTPIHNTFTSAITDPLIGNWQPSKHIGLLYVQGSIGRILWNNETSHGKLSVLLSIPTSNTNTHQDLFSAHHVNNQWKIGSSLAIHHQLKEYVEHRFSFNGIIEGWVVLPHHEYRTFDLRDNGLFSRYMPYKQYDNSNVISFAFGKTVNTHKCTIGSQLLLDSTILFTYENNQLQCSIGYNGWIRSAEHIRLNTKQPTYQYGIKGLTQLFNPTTLQTDFSTQSHATIFTYENETDTKSTFLYKNAYAYNLKSVSTPLHILHAMCGSIMYQATQQASFGIKSMISFEGLHHDETQTFKESAPATITLAIGGSYTW